MTSKNNPGQRLLSERVWLRLAQRLGLSPTEVLILRGLLNDKTEARVARLHGMSSHTVHTHVKRMYRKLEVTSRGAAVGRVFEEYLRLERSNDLDCE